MPGAEDLGLHRPRQGNPLTARDSRGLVLVKWWLLVIPHYLIVALLVGGAGYYIGSTDDRSGLWAGGLIPLLVLVAGALLLFTGRYPQPLFDLVLGLNRWVLRVAGYAGLMTDTYPPFRLDQGGHEGAAAGTPVLTPRPASATASPAVSPPPPQRPGSGWTASRVLSLVVGCVLAIVGLGLAVPGLALLLADQAGRDEAGFVMSPEQTLETSTYGITSGDLQLHGDAPGLSPRVLLGDAKLTATGADGSAVFLGIGPATDVRAYLAEVEHTMLVEIRDNEPIYRTTTGGPPAAAPDEADFWVAKSSGSGTQEVTWTPENGDWTVLVMNADASRGVDVTAAAGAEVPSVPWVVGILLALSATGLLLGAVLIAVPLRGVSRDGRERAEQR